MKKLAYSSEAVSNLKQIYDHAGKYYSKEKADAVVSDIFQRIAALQKFPHLGKTSDISDLVRELTVEGNKIYYQITEESVDIVFIRPRKTTADITS